MISTALLTVELLAAPGGAEITAVAGVEGSCGQVLADGYGSYVSATAVLRDGHGVAFGKATSWCARRPRQEAAPRAQPMAAPRVDCAADPLSHMLGLDGLTADAGGVAFRLPAVGHLTNRSGILHGDVGAMLAHHAAVAAVEATPAVPEVLSLSTHYHRAAGADGGPVQVRSSRIRRGRTSAVALGQVDAPDGRAALTTTVTMAPR